MGRAVVAKSYVHIISAVDVARQHTASIINTITDAVSLRMHPGARIELASRHSNRGDKPISHDLATVCRRGEIP